MISHRKSTPFYPCANGQQAESTNKVLEAILTKTVSVTQTNWDLKLIIVLWAYQTLYKVPTRCTPFKLVYGLEVIMPWKFLIPSLRVEVAEKWDGHKLSNRICILENFNEEWHIALQGLITKKQHRK